MVPTNDNSGCYSTLIENKSIVSLLNKHSDNHEIQDQIREAARILCADQSKKNPAHPDTLVKCLKRAADVIERGKLQIFVSYKSEEDAKAEEIVNAFRDLSSNIEVRCAVEYPKDITGQGWREQVHKDIDWADWLLLVLPEPSAKLDWPLFETGVFYGQRTCPAVEKLLILHHSDNKLPAPIDEVESIEVEFERVKKALNRIIKKPNAIPGLKPLWKNADTKKAAERIVSVIKPPHVTKPIFHGPMLALKILHSDEVESAAQLIESEVFDLDNYILRIFDKAVNLREFFIGKTLREFIGDSMDLDNPESIGWLRRLVYEINKARNHGFVSSIYATLQGSEDNVFRPFIVSGQEHPGSSFTVYYIAFVEDISVVNKDIPRDLVLIHTALTFAYRFRWEVIDKFFSTYNTNDEVAHLEDRISRIETEAETYGLLDPEALAGFYNKKNATRIREIYSFWQTQRNEEKNGALDTAINGGDAKKVSQIFLELAEMNNWLVSILSTKFSELHEKAAESRNYT